LFPQGWWDMGRNKLPYFPFDAGDYLNDPAVMLMDADAEGCYIRCLARSWQTSTPGRINAELLPEYCGFHRLSDQYRVMWRKDWATGEVSPEEIGRERIDEIIPQLARAFDTVSEPGWLVQKRMVLEHKRLTRRLEARQGGAAKTNEQRALVRSPNGNRAVIVRRPTEEVDVEVEKEVEESKSKDLATDVAVGGVLTLSKRQKTVKRKTPEDVEWERTFHEWFWPAYWRKASKTDALKAWMGIAPKTQDMVESINEGLLRHKPVIASRDKDKQPHASTWLNQRRWEDLDA